MHKKMTEVLKNIPSALPSMNPFEVFALTMKNEQHPHQPNSPSGIHHHHHHIHTPINKPSLSIKATYKYEALNSTHFKGRKNKLPLFKKKRKIHEESNR